MNHTIKIGDDLIRIADISAVRLQHSTITVILKNGISLVNKKMSLGDYEVNYGSLSANKIMIKYHEYIKERIAELEIQMEQIESAINVNHQ